MKKMVVFLMMFGLLASATYAADEKEIFNPAAGAMEAPQIYNAMKQNKFAFKKTFMDKKILVGGIIEKIDEARFDVMNMESPQLPQLDLKGSVYAFLAEKQGNLDLAQINPGDYFFGICTSFTEGLGGLSVKAKCQPVMITRSENGQFHRVWLTPDKAALDFSFTPQMVKKLTKK